MVGWNNGVPVETIGNYLELTIVLESVVLDWVVVLDLDWVVLDLVDAEMVGLQVLLLLESCCQDSSVTGSVVVYKRLRGWPRRTKY